MQEQTQKHTCLVSVIVPVYNVETYVAKCLDSLAGQTMPKDQMEAVVVVDGSTDGSHDICKQYADKYSWIKLYSKENEGLSRTRNYALKRATGKYIMYLDSDDTYTPETVKSVVSFFEKHQDEVNVVGYKLQPYRGGKKLGVHFRYHYLEKSGVYDLEEFPFLTQTNINICTKNKFEDNILFDTTPGFRHEDQKYCTDVLDGVFKYGYCAKGEYQYNKDNESSIVSTYFYAYYIFETTMQYYEDLFASYGDNIPPYIQGLLLNDVRWKLQQDILLPYHYEPAEFDAAIARIRNLMKKVDTNTILHHPAMDNYQKSYWLHFKGNVDVYSEISRGQLELWTDGLEFEKRKDFLVKIHFVRISGDEMEIMGFVASNYFTFFPDQTCNVYLDLDGERVKVDTFLSLYSYYKARIVTNQFFGFRYRCPVSKAKNIRVFVEVEGEEFPGKLDYQPYSGFSRRFYFIKRGNYLISKSKKKIRIRRCGRLKKIITGTLQTASFFAHPRVCLRRVKALLANKKRKIWLYYDFYTVPKDNGYYQFINDFQHKDGIDRYYVVTHEYEDLDQYFTKEQQNYLIQMGSEEHKHLYLLCDRIFTGYYGLSPVNPFNTELEERQYRDLIDQKTVYLQHGVLHASLYLNNSVERCRADQIVVSSPFEYQNYIENYGYEPQDLIQTGMARYDHMDFTREPKNRILFAPSWRKYLTQILSVSKWELQVDKLKASDYYQNFMKFLNDPKLHTVLEEMDYHLDIKLHPVIAGEPGVFEVDCERIQLVSDVEIADYKAFMTDFSSYVFDFAPFKRAIMYFVPDYIQFKAGMNHYRELDLPFEDAFGPFATTPEDAVQNFLDLAKRGFEPEQVYYDRMDAFFYPLEDCAERLYQQIMEQDNAAGI